jgi:long-chain acyl-CoA synthetase
VGQYYLLENGELEVFAPGGSMRTGDIGYLDEEGFLFVTGRKKNVIIRGGINVSPLQVDRVLLEHPRIDEAATVGIPDSIYGEEVVSLVVLKAGTRAENHELIAHCKTKLSREMVPKDILIVEEIPKSDRGKVVKQQLLDLYFSRGGSGRT